MEELSAAVETLINGGVVVIPTDTVYGIAAHPQFSAAVARLGMIKGRDQNKPIALLAADRNAVLKFCCSVPSEARALMEFFWPGALTIVLPCGGVFEGFRVPDHRQTCSLLRACGGVLRVTSANLSGSMPAVSAMEALKNVGLEADLVIDDGPSPGGQASTVVRVAGDGRVEILRVGALSAAQIYSVVGNHE